MPNPPFNDALGVSVMTRQGKPPMRFEGVTLRMFPLRANMFRLREFIDSYLNLAPNVVHFRPAMPCVFLMVLDYGKMSAEVANFGWVSQREVGFAVPLEWYDMTDGKKFVNSATVCPFIYVDDETSLSTGRTVYGWPKVKVWAHEEVNPWLYDPRSSQHLLQLSTMVFPELYAGKRQQPRVFLEVRREPLPSFSFPPEPDHFSNPLSIIPGALQDYLGIFGTAVQMLSNPPLLGYPAGSPVDALTAMMRMGTSGLSSLASAPVGNNITLKQFRDAEKPDSVCFQAIVNSKISTERFNRGGMLGDTNLLMGDPTGGFRIVMHHYDAQPVVDSLGIEVAQELEVEGRRVDVLRPMYPFWADVDMEYDIGVPICWRTRHSTWHVGSPNTPPAGTEVRGDAAPESQAHEDHEESRENPYNTARSGALQAVAGPFDFPNVTMRVLPLLADPKKLDDFCKEYLKSDTCVFEAWGSYVYLVATSYEEMSSKTNNIGWWADRELSFLVPVKQKSGDELVSVGVIPAFSFVNTSRAAIVANEVKGQPTVRAEIDSPPGVWMNDSGPSEHRDQPLLGSRSSVLPALFVGQGAEMRNLVEVRRADALPDHDLTRWRMVAYEWGRTLLAEHRRLVKTKQEKDTEEKTDLYRVARALALEPLANGKPFNIFSRKQFRDSEDPELACYEAIVRTRRSVQDIYDLREIDERLHVYMFQQPSLPIVEKLGLKIKWSDVTGEVPVDILQPARPFWMKLALRESLGQDLRWRAGSTVWKSGDEKDCAAGYFTGKDATDGDEGANVGDELLQILEEPREELFWRRRLKAAAREWRSGSGSAERRQGSESREKEAGEPRDWPLKEVAGSGTARSKRYTRDLAVEAVEKIEPQMVVEGILSAEWMHWGNSRRQRNAWIKPDLCFRADSVGETVKPSDLPGGIKEGWYSEDMPRPGMSSDSKKT